MEAPLAAKKSTKKVNVKDLKPAKAGSVKAGRKAGKGQQDYLIVKTSEVL